MRFPLFIASLCLLASATLSANEILREYWEYDFFLQQQPEQQRLTLKMQELVDNAPVPMEWQREDPIKIDIVYPGAQLSDYWWRNIKALELRLTELGIQYQINRYSSRPNLDFRKEEAAFKAVEVNQPDYLISTLDTSRHRKFAERILNKRKTKLILLNITTPIKRWKEQQPLMYVGFDHVQGTNLIARHYQSLFPGSARYGVVYFSPGYISDVRGDTFIRSLEAAGDYQLRRGYYTHANRESAYQATLSMLAKVPDVDFIYACSTDVAFGVAEALSELKRDDIYVNGWGGGAELEAVKQGILDFTIMRMTDDTGIAIAEAIKLDLQGKKVPTVFSGDFEVVTHEDDRAKFEALESRAFRYSDQ